MQQLKLLIQFALNFSLTSIYNTQVLFLHLVHIKIININDASDLYYSV